MVELKADKPLRRGIPGTDLYLELYGTRMVVKVRGSKRSGVSVVYRDAIQKAGTYPDSAPAKIKDALDYLRWVATKTRRLKEK